MIHTQKLVFQHNGTDFEAMVHYSDAPFGDRLYKKEPIFFNVQLHKPISLNCGGESVKIGGISSMMLLSRAVHNRHYVYDEQPETKEDDEINIYPRAVAKILYFYYNHERIDCYNEKILRFSEAVDAKCEAGLETLRAQRRVLRWEMREGRIDSKTYQKRYRPIRLKKNDLEYKISNLKSRYRRRYFDCCELKSYYRIDKPEQAKGEKK